MYNNKTNRIVLAGLLVGLGILLPFVTSHMFGVQGAVFLPMHIPVFLMGFLCGPMYGALGGLIIPLLSSLFTGMPPVFPMLPIMMGELLVYGLISGLLYHKTKMPLYPAMLISMVCGRLMYAGIFGILMVANSGNLRALSVTGAFVTGVPGIIIQLLLVPAIIFALKKYTKNEVPTELPSAEYKAKQMVKSAAASCVLIKDNRIVHTANGHGVAPLILTYENEPELLKDAFVVDKIIGKAAAMIIVLGGAKEAYGEIMSATACEYLAKHGCKISYSERIELVANRLGDGMCPLESSVLEIDDPAEGYRLLKITIDMLRNAG